MRRLEIRKSRERGIPLHVNEPERRHRRFAKIAVMVDRASPPITLPKPASGTFSSIYDVAADTLVNRTYSLDMEKAGKKPKG